MNWSEIFQFWGAGLATILGVIKFLEFSRDRRQLHLTYSSMDHENTIVVSSIGRHPVFIQSYFLYWRPHRWYGKRIELNLAFPDDEVINRSISIDSPLTLNFKEENYFSSTRKDMPNGKLFLGLRIAGNRNPKIFKVYP